MGRVTYILPNMGETAAVIKLSKGHNYIMDVYNI